ncbi:MAG: nucleotide pyrophosphohydrolase [Candidatus Riflebacteria bacterium]|nr:nucleotide pyrophosphohydrolase [Candidatus Riflebacteria bacterium]
MNDNETTISELKQLVDKFITEREWRKYHTPRNLAASICIEAAELLEHFQWDVFPDSDKTEESENLTVQAESSSGPSIYNQSNSLGISETRHKEIAEEMADVIAYLLSLSIYMKIDLSSTLSEKMIKNAKKYPVDQFKGKWKRI